MTADSSDDEPAAAKAADGAARRHKAPFSKDHIFEAVCGDGAQSVASRLSTHFNDDQVRAEWAGWHANAAERLADVPSQRRALPLRMPMKCNAQARPDEPREEREQHNLMTYKNPGGTRYSKDALQRDAKATRRLRASEVPVGCTVGLRRDDGDPWTPAGYGTPFYVGDVLERDLDEAEQVVTHVLVHYRMPTFQRQFCNDVTKPLKLACVALHEWDSGCEKRRACTACRPPGAATSRMTVRTTADTLFEVGIDLVQSGALSMQARRNICSTDESWRAALNLRDSRTTVGGDAGVARGAGSSGKKRRR